MKNKIKLCVYFSIMFILFPLNIFAATGTVLTSAGGSLASGTYYLNSNITLTNTITIASGKNVTINLNGYVLKGNGNNRVITNQGTLRIIDKPDSSTTKIHYGDYIPVERVVNRNNRAELYGNNYDGKAWEIEIVDDIIWKYEGTVDSVAKVPSGKIVIENGIITEGYSTRGAAVYNQGGTFYLEGGTLCGNHAYRLTSTSTSSPVSEGHGGAVYSHNWESSNGLFEMTGGTIIYNCGDGTGGGVRVESGTFIMKSGVIEHNETTASGGGVNVQGNSVNPEFVLGAPVSEKVWHTKYENDPTSIPVIKDNRTKDTRNTGNGAGIHVQTGILTYNAGIICDNKSRGSGGGIYAYSGANVQAQTKFCIIENNRTEKSGGGIMQQYGVISLSESIIRNNYANSGGGGISVRVGDFTMTNGVVSYNVSKSNGGGISASAQNNISPHGDPGNLGCEVTIRGGSFIGNETTEGNGGGIYISVKNSTEECNVDIVGGNFSDNVAAMSGGAIYLEGGNLTIGEESDLETIVSGNKAGKYGGAAYIADMQSTTCYIKDPDKYGTKLETDKNPKNYSEYFSKTTPGNVKVTGGDFTDNNAILYGGAIYVTGGSFEFSGTGAIKNCKAACGGAAYVNGGNFTMNGGNIEKNTATESGGGLQISDGNVYIIAGKISSNVARGEATTKAVDVGYGGGIFVDGGDVVQITGGEITNNVAAKNGGGIEIKTSQLVTIDIYSGTFTGNVADECGGAFGIECDNGTINLGKQNCDGLVSSSHSHPVLTDNLAGVHGAGFYMSGTKAKLNIYCSLVDNNKIGEVENNFEQLKGVVTVYYGVRIGTSNEGVIVIGGTFIDERTTNQEKFDIYYYSNYEGDEQYHHAQVTSGTQITLPGDIFGVDNYDILGWTTDNTNTTIADYDVGQVVKITSNLTLYGLWIIEGDNSPQFIVYIPAEIGLNTNNTIEIFDIEATVKNLSRSQVLRIEFVEKEFELLLQHDLENSEAIPYIIVNDEQELEDGSIILEIYSDSPLITYNASEELEIQVLSEPEYAGIYQDTMTFSVSIDNISL